MTFFIDRTAIADVLADLAHADACAECAQQPRVEVRGHNDLSVALLHSTHCMQFADEVKAEMVCRQQRILHDLTGVAE